MNTLGENSMMKHIVQFKLSKLPIGEQDNIKNELSSSRFHNRIEGHSIVNTKGVDENS